MRAARSDAPGSGLRLGLDARRTLAGGSQVTMTPEGGTMTGSMTVTVVAGTGDFAGRVGVGTFTQNSALPAPPKPPPPPGAAPSRPARPSQSP